MSKLDIPSADFAPDLARGNLKMAMASAGATNPHALWTVPPSQLRVIDGFNGRIRTPAYLEHLAGVKNSIRENGYYQDKPLAGYVAKEDGEDVIYVTEGHTRFEAVAELTAEGHEIEKVPVVIKPNGTSMEDLTVALVTSNDGRPFTTYEKALMVKRLVGMGLDEATIAKRLGFKTGKSYVDDLLTLAGAPKAVRDLVIAEKITATMAIDELKGSGAKAAERLKAAVDTAAANGKSKATPKHLDKSTKPKKAKAAKTEAPSGPIKPQVDADDVLADAQKCGFVINEDVSEDMILKLAATLLDRVGAEVYAEEPASDPAADL